MQANLRAKYTFHSNVHYWNGYHKKQRVLPRPLHYHTLHYLTFELHLLHYCFPVQNLFAICLSFTDVILGISNGRKSHRPLKCKTRSVGYFARKQFGPVYIFFLYFNFFFCCHSCSKSAARVTIDIPSVSANSCSALCGAAARRSGKGWRICFHMLSNSPYRVGPLAWLGLYIDAAAVVVTYWHIQTVRVWKS